VTDASELQAQGIQHFQKKRYDEAAALFQQAQAAYEADHQPDMAAEMRVNLGLVYRAQGEYQQALDEMSAAYSVFEGMGDQKRLAMTLGNMGAAYKALDDKEQAYRCYRDAADLFDAVGEKALYGETLVAMADLQMSEHKVTASAATYEVGLSEMENLTASQKVIRNLVGLRNRLTGGG
jgi:tetratricopeptide (TPR) repeat protein